MENVVESFKVVILFATKQTMNCSKISSVKHNSVVATKITSESLSVCDAAVGRDLVVEGDVTINGVLTHNGAVVTGGGTVVNNVNNITNNGGFLIGFMQKTGSQLIGGAWTQVTFASTFTNSGIVAAANSFTIP